MYDKFEIIGKSKAYHGKYNDRIYLMNINKDDYPEIIQKLDILAEKESYSKIFVKVPESLSDNFLSSGYKTEASIKKLFANENGLFLSKFKTVERALPKEPEEIKKVYQISKSKKSNKISIELPDGYFFRKLGKNDVIDMSKIYKKVFSSYPFPIFDPKYLTDTINENIEYFGIFKGIKLIAISSTEKYEEHKHVEMTDFATLPEFRGKGLGTYLLIKMEEYMKKHHYKIAYTICRASKVAINSIFSKLGYNYDGTLINNTNIGNSLESMNVWHKEL